jgi:hypothetical protein
LVARAINRLIARVSISSVPFDRTTLNGRSSIIDRPHQLL